MMMSVFNPGSVLPGELDERDIAALVAANDRLLEPLVRARLREEREAALEVVLMQHARPVIERVLSRYGRSDQFLGASDAEDIAGTVVLRLVGKLQAATRDEHEAIAHFEDFTAALTFNALYDIMRRHFPQRTRLKNRTRHTVVRDARFRTRNAPPGLVCALSAWPPTEDVAPRYHLQPPRRTLDRSRLGDAVEQLLAAAGRPALLDDLVDVLAIHWNVADPPADEMTGNAADPSVPHPTRLESRQYLEVLWGEIQQLRGTHRAALLLNLRDADGGNAIALFVLVGIASIDEIAAAVELPVETLAQLWNGLPLDDRTIASMLGVTRQQVINLRKTARERLTRRMGSRT